MLDWARKHLSLPNWAQRKLSLIDWVAITAALIFVVYKIKPDDMALLAYKGALLGIGVVAGVYLDNRIFPGGKAANLIDPDEASPWTQAEATVFVGAMIRRAFMIWIATQVIGRGL